MNRRYAAYVVIDECQDIVHAEKCQDIVHKSIYHLTDGCF